MKKLIIPIVLFSAVLFSCKKEIITLDGSNGVSSEVEYFDTKASGPNPTCNNPGDGGDDDVITDPNNDADEDKRRKGK